MATFYIFTNFTFTYKVYLTPIIFQLSCFFNNPGTGFQSFIENIPSLLCSILHLVMRSKTCTIRFTAAAGTNLACAYTKLPSLYSLKIKLYNVEHLHHFRRLTGSYLYILSKIPYCSKLLRHFFKPCVAVRSLKSAKHLRLNYTFNIKNYLIL